MPTPHYTATLPVIRFLCSLPHSVRLFIIVRKDKPYSVSWYCTVTGWVSNTVRLPINTTTITALENRFAIQLNSIAACALLYEFSNTSLINSTEKKAIEKRMYQIADGFIANNTYIVLQTSAGISPTYGITETTQKGKKVITLFLGGDCLVSNHEEQLEIFYNLFNQYMKKKL